MTRLLGLLGLLRFLGLLSLLGLLGLPGFIYFTLNLATPVVRRATRRQLALLPREHAWQENLSLQIGEARCTAIAKPSGASASGPNALSVPRAVHSRAQRRAGWPASRSTP